MSNSATTIIRVCPEHMCRIFEREQLQRRVDSGEFRQVTTRSAPCSPPFRDAFDQLCVLSQEIELVDDRFAPEHPFHTVARCHRYVTETGATGASGKMDPKELLIGQTAYRMIKSKNPHCQLCENGDMIPLAERFRASKYRPESNA